jgi:hypothetical protein
MAKRSALKELKKGRGGARAGAGMPKGTKTKKTLDKEAAREVLRELVKASMGPLVAAQISNATGIHYLVVRDKASGKFLRVGSGRAETLKPDEEIIEIWEKDPSVQAFTDLMNRTIDKPIDQVEMAHSGALVIRHELPD